jgi:hypothetical protein
MIVGGSGIGVGGMLIVAFAVTEKVLYSTEPDSVKLMRSSAGAGFGISGAPDVPCE